MFDDFLCEQQSDEYRWCEDWLAYLAGMYETNEEEEKEEVDDGWYEFEPGKFGWDEAAANP